jgi:transposase
VVAEVARRADFCTSLVYKWRREARKAADACGFAAVVVETATAHSSGLSAESTPESSSWK